MALAARRQNQVSHLQFETTVYDWQGAQITLICFDELMHFSAHQFFYMVSRNRSTCGVRPYIRATPPQPGSMEWFEWQKRKAERLARRDVDA
jgi:Terminase large subunit, T4likevirus-type, N-terminal